MGVVIAYFALLVSPTFAAEMRGWQNTTWGMTESQVRALYSSKLTSDPLSDGSEDSPFRFGGYTVASCTFEVRFWFAEGKLARVTLDTAMFALSRDNVAEFTSYESCKNDVVDLMKQKYGKADEAVPQTKQLTGRMSLATERAMVWFEDNTSIMLSALMTADVAQPESGMRRKLRLTYRNRNSEAASKL
jgi:hypothetical protein